MENLVKSHPDSEIFLALKGVGTNLAARIMVEFGDDRSYYPQANAIQCEAGTAPVTRKSGKRRFAHFRRACKKSFRNTMLQFALQMVKHESWCKKMFQKHRKRGRSPSESLRIIANTWIRILLQRKTRKKKKANRKQAGCLSNWSFGKVKRYLKYKLAQKGIELHEVDEAYTSQTCPVCQKRRKVSSRNSAEAVNIKNIETSMEPEIFYLSRSMEKSLIWDVPTKQTYLRIA